MTSRRLPRLPPREERPGERSAVGPTRIPLSPFVPHGEREKIVLQLCLIQWRWGPWVGSRLRKRLILSVSLDRSFLQARGAFDGRDDARIGAATANVPFHGA